MLCGIGFSGIYIVIGKCKEVLFASKANRYNWPNEININILIRLYCFWLGVTIILLFGFCSFAAIADQFLYIDNEFNVVVYEIFFQHSKVQLAKFLIL